MGAFVTHTPLYAYANNSDFYRLADWHGITDVAGQPLREHPETPLQRYVFEPSLDGEHPVISSELLFLELAVWLQRVSRYVLGADLSVFDIRWWAAYTQRCSP